MTDLEVWEKFFTDQGVTYKKVYVFDQLRVYLQLTESPLVTLVDSETIIWFNAEGWLTAVQSTA